MARPREFDLEKACEDAMNVFWEGGFKETSLPDLLDGLRLSRGSLYKAFGSKKNLFVEALSLYDQSILQPGVLLLKDATESNGSDRIRAFFDGSLSRVAQGDRRGCLLCNAAVGAAHSDQNIAVVVNRMLDDLTQGFSSALKDTDKFGSVTERERMAKASEITMAYVGLRVLARSGAELDQLEAAVNSALDNL